MTTAEDICQGIPSERLDSSITDIQIADLASDLKTWEELTPYLGLTPADEEEIQVDYQGRYGLQKRQALRKWQSKLGRGPNGATYRNFIIALCRAEEIKMAEKVRNLLTEPEESATSAADHVLKTFRNYLVDCYTIAQHPAQTQWPFSRLTSYIDLTLVQAPDAQMPPSGQEVRAQPLKAVQLTELFHVGSHQARRKVVLIEGPAGCGKTTLSWHVCQEWAAGRLFKQFSLLIHISLEDQQIHSANCLADTIPHESREMRQSVAIAISQQGGRNVCFLFDAWDEAPRGLQGRNSYLYKLISGSSIRMLPHCSIVVTSRPVAAGLYPYSTARVNIRGFGAIKLKEFIDVSLEDCTSKQKLLQALREKPQVNDLCNLPINAAIVVHLFQSSYSNLPSTRTGIFRALVCNLLLRYVQLRTDHRLEEVQELTEFEQLPYDILQHFKSVCGLAFQGIMEDRKVFLLDSLQKLGLKHPSSPLGLIQVQQQLTGFGARHCYSFLHYAVQEFLAAYHISKLSEEEQTKSVGQILHSIPLSTVLPFYAGLTGLSNEGACDILLEVTKQPLDRFAVALALRHTLHESSDRRRLLLALCNCIYEAQKPSMCKLVNPPRHPTHSRMLQGNGIKCTPGMYTQLSLYSCNISFCYLGLDAVDCLSIGYFIFNKCLVSKKALYVDLSYCYIGDTEVEILIKQIRKVPSNKPGVEISLGHNTVCHGTITALLDALIQTSALQGIVLDGSLHPATTDIKSALKYLTEGVSRNTSLNELGIGHCSLGPAHAYHLALLAAVCNTTQLDLSRNNIRSAIPFIAEAIKHNRAIEGLHLAWCYICDRELILLGKALQHNDKLQSLHIEHNLFTSSALSQFLNGLIGTHSRLWLLNIDRPLTDVQRHTIGLINYIRLQQSLPPLQVLDMAFTRMTASEASDSIYSAPPDIRSRFAFKESTN